MQKAVDSRPEERQTGTVVGGVNGGGEREGGGERRREWSFLGRCWWQLLRSHFTEAESVGRLLYCLGGGGW